MREALRLALAALLAWVGMGTEEPDPFPGAIGSFRKMLDRSFR